MAQCWSEQATLAKNNPQWGDYFGWSFEVDGTTAIVGAPREDNLNGGNAGALYLFERDLGGPGAWGKVGKKVVLNGTSGDHLGESVGVSGDTAAAGAPFGNDGVGSGAAYVFERDLGGPGAWGQQAVLVPSDAEFNDRFGNAISIDGDVTVVGAPSEDSGGYACGAAYVFERNVGGPGAWGETQKLLPSAPLDSLSFGGAVTIDGDTLVVAAAGGTFPLGSAYVFERIGTTWVEVKRIVGPAGQAGSLFGWPVSLSGDTLLIGAMEDSEVGSKAGAAYVFERDLGGPGNWGERIKLLPPNGGKFGSAVALAGDIALVGAPKVETSYLYERDLGGPNSWGEVARLQDVDAGRVVSLDDELFPPTALDSGATPGVGLVHVYVRGSDAMRYCTSGTSASGCQAFLTACGTPSESGPSGFVLTANQVEGTANGIFFFGSNGRQATPWGNGTSFQCVAPPVKRGGVVKGTGTQGVCDGLSSQDLNALWCRSCPKPAKFPGAGSVVQAQFWYRDAQSTSNQSTSLSDAVEFAVAP